MNMKHIPEKMKNWPWKKIVFGVAVVSSVAASSSFGTYAYFTSSKNEATAFAAGKLEIGLGQNSASFQAADGQPFLPGVRFEKELTVSNESDVPVKYAIQASKKAGEDVVYNQLMAEIRVDGDAGELLYAGRINQLSESNVVVPNVDKGGSSNLHFTVYLPESAGNEVQQKSAEVDFGFLATQIENGEYFAQKGPVITLTPADFAGLKGDSFNKIVEDSAEETTFILAEGTYDLSGLANLPKHVTWKAEKGKEGKVIIQADGSKLENATLDGFTIKGSGAGITVGSHVNIVNCTFEGSFDAAIQTAEAESLEGLTVRNSKFKGATDAIVLDQPIIGVVIGDNVFEQVSRAVVAADDKKSQIQVVNNDFNKVAEHAVVAGINRIGDGIEGFKETAEADGDVKKLALHLRELDIYVENNKYPSQNN